MAWTKKFLNTFLQFRENQARKGKQKSWMKRGQFGTGKLAPSVSQTNCK